jgi:hypothetical protein
VERKSVVERKGRVKRAAYERNKFEGGGRGGGMTYETF